MAVMVEQGVPQHMRALQRANEVRLARAEVKRQVAVGERDVVSVMLEQPFGTGGMSVGELLLAQRRWGRHRMRRVVARLGVSEAKRLESFTERQRAVFADALSAAAGALSERSGDA